MTAAVSPHDEIGRSVRQPVVLTEVDPDRDVEGLLMADPHVRQPRRPEGSSGSLETKQLRRSSKHGGSRPTEATSRPPRRSRRALGSQTA